MTSNNNQQVPWSDDQWARVRKVIQDEAARARVAASFLPLVGPLPADTDYVPMDKMSYPEVDGKRRLQIDDRNTMELATLQVKVYLRGAQMADPDMTSALQLFRRAANVLARLEDSVVFRGLKGRNPVPDSRLPGAEVLFSGDAMEGLVAAGEEHFIHYLPTPLKMPGSGGATGKSDDEIRASQLGSRLVQATSKCIGELEGQGHFGPFAIVLDHALFTEAQTPNEGSLVLPQDRILPFLGGGPMLRSSTLPAQTGVVLALGAAPIELVIATDVSLNFLQVTNDPLFVFRVYEKIALRVKEGDAVCAIKVSPDAQQRAGSK